MSSAGLHSALPRHDMAGDDDHIRVFGGGMRTSVELITLYAWCRYFEMVNVHAGVRDELYKVASVNMCPNTTGQVPSTALSTVT